MSIKEVNKLEVKSVGRLLLEFSIPSVIAMFANALYNVVDRIFVGHGIGEKALEAVAFAFPIMSILLAFGMLVGIGSTAIVSIKLGQHDQEGAERVFGNAVAAFLVMSVAIPVIFLLSLDNILILLGATDPEVFSYAKQFTIVILLGSGFQFFSFGINNLIRADGKPLLSMKTMLAGTIMNLVFNPLFIFVFNWGIRGSALATVTTQMILSIFILYHFTKGGSDLKLRYSNIKLEMKEVKSILSIGMSPFMTQIAASMTFFVFNHYLYIHGGGNAVAAFGIINSVVMLFLMPMFGINQGSQPIIGYNYGAGQYDRVKKTVKYGTIAAMSLGVIAFFVSQLFSRQIMSFFSSDPELISIGASGMRVYLSMLFLVGGPVFIANYFQSIGKAGISIFLSLTRQVIFLIPLVIILPNHLGLWGIWIAGPISDVIAFFLSGIMLTDEMRKIDLLDSVI